MIDLTDKVALVTGGSRGIGRACARRLAEAGAHLVVNYVTSRAAAMELGEALRAFGRDVAVIKADVTERDDIDSLIEFIRREFGRLYRRQQCGHRRVPAVARDHGREFRGGDEYQCATRAVFGSSGDRLAGGPARANQSDRALQPWLAYGAADVWHDRRDKGGTGIVDAASRPGTRRTGHQL